MNTPASDINPDNTGEILIQDKDNATYHLPAPQPGSGTVRPYSFTEPGTRVPNDVARTLQFILPSATRIFLCDLNRYSHEWDQNFWIELITTRKRTATEYIEIDYLDTYQPGAIIQPGLRMVRKYRKNKEPMRDCLSYARITASTAPPNTHTDD